jgi:hypothetical protein
VAEYLKSNGYDEILAEFQAIRKIQPSNEQSATIEKIMQNVNAKSSCQIITSSDETRLDAWTPIREGFSDVIEHLDPDDPDHEVDKVVKYILDENILVRHINVKFRNYSLENVRHKTKQKNAMKMNCPNVKFGRMCKGVSGDNGKILTNWADLVSNAQVINPLKCIMDFTRLVERDSNLGLLKQNILGCYLAQDLTHVRLSAEVFTRAVSLLYLNIDGKYSKEEDDLIFEVVQNVGANLKAWNYLAEELKRQPSCICTHYFKLIGNRGMKIGRWSDEDFSRFFDFLFNKANLKKENGPNYIQSIPFLVINEAAKYINRSPFNVQDQWAALIKPILLAYHDGTLLHDQKKDFMEYLVSKKCSSMHDIDWEEAKSLFPNHTTSSLSLSLNVFRKQKTLITKPLYQCIEEYLPKLKNAKSNRRRAEYREKIVYLYDKVRGFKV